MGRRGRNAEGSSHAPLWCADCQRTHNGTHDDARAIMGAQGRIASVAYARCSAPGGCGMLHTTHLPAPTERIPDHGRVRIMHTDNTAQPERAVRVTRATTTDTLADEVGTRAASFAVNVQARRFAEAFAAQRTRSVFM